MNELKNLQATGLSTLGTSLKEAFDLLNLYRLHSGIDNYGMVSYVICGKSSIGAKHEWKGW